MNKKIWSVVFGLGLAFTLAACGEQAQETTPPAATTPAKPPAATTPPAASTPAATPSKPATPPKP
ncbi:hypothetical protein ACE1CI_31575 [Aerosakkonemataceae cyanobacterium BLCC-F50]|uniref:Uncharacterized protein n=1 Tax=Floridaenema flaviceps BLCC-F50 TaxID=3153642 RepID=A0ABV4Y0M2_9CYAN